MSPLVTDWESEHDGLKDFLELEFVTQTEQVDIRLVVIIVVIDVLIAVEEADGMLAGEFPVETGSIANLLKAPGIEKLDTSIRRNSKTFLIVLHLQTTAKHILALAVIDLLLAIIGLIEVAPTLTDGMLRAIGILPALTQRETEVAKELLVER